MTKLPASAKVIGYAHYGSNIIDTTTTHAGIKVELEGTTYSTVTDETGRWEMNNIHLGTYTVSFSKENYYTYKCFNRTFFENGINYLVPDPYVRGTITILPLPTYLHASDLTFERLVDSFHSKFKFQSTCDNIYPEYDIGGFTMVPVVFFSKDSIIDPLRRDIHTVAAFDQSHHSISRGETVSCNISVYTSDLVGTGLFKSGDTVYCVGYTGYDDDKYYYFDPMFGAINIGFSPNHTQTLKFIVP